MRVIAGKLGGRNFNPPAGHRTHPMSDKVRGALFNALGDIEGLTVLDAFAGSGALSFEAISRGAAHVTAIDSDRNAQRVITQNAQTLDVAGQLKLIKATAEAWLSTASETFDIVICDPPYDGIKSRLLHRVAERCQAGGIVVFSLPPDREITLSDCYQYLSSKNYGDASLNFYRKAG